MDFLLSLLVIIPAIMLVYFLDKESFYRFRIQFLKFLRGAFFGLIGGLSIILGLGVLAYQIYFCLKLGFWEEMSLLYFLYDKWDWAAYPTEWVGLHKIVDGTPLFIGLIVVGGVLCYVWDRIHDENTF